MYVLQVEADGVEVGKLFALGRRVEYHAVGDDEGDPWVLDNARTSARVDILSLSSSRRHSSSLVIHYCIRLWLVCVSKVKIFCRDFSSETLVWTLSRGSTGAPMIWPPCLLHHSANIYEMFNHK